MSKGSTAPGLLRSLILMPCLVLGCGNEPVEHYPIQVFHLEFPDSVQARATDSLRVGAEVGYLGCQPERVRVERRGDSLFVTGMAHCVVRYTNARKTSGPGADTPPAQPNPRWLSIAIPGLEAGRYWVVAGILTDTLVAASTHSQQHTRVVAHGTLRLVNDAACPAGLGTFTTNVPYRFRRVYEVLNPPASVGSGLSCEIHATLAGPATCDSTHALGALRLRSLSPTLIGAARTTAPRSPDTW